MKLVIGTNYDGLFTAQEIGELEESIFRNNSSVKVVASPRTENLGCIWSLNDEDFQELTVAQARMIIEAVPEMKTLSCLNDYIKENEHIFDMDAAFTPSPALKRNVISNFRNAIGRFGYMSTDKAVGSIIDEEMKNKGWIASMISSHPNYNGNLQIVRKIKVKRPFDGSALQEFVEWAQGIVREYYGAAHDQTVFGIKNGKTIDNLKEFLRCKPDYDGIEIRLPDGTQIKSAEERDAIRAELRSYRFLQFESKYITLKRTDRRELHGIEEALNILRWYHSDTLDAPTARKLQKFFPEKQEDDAFFVDDEGSGFPTKEQTKAYKRMGLVEGKKITKVIGAICRLACIDKYTHEYTDSFWADGDLRTKVVKDGYDQKYAALCDAISPKETEYTYVVSIHPTDYVYSAIGHKWSSCHTIDKLNMLNFVDHNGNATYHGMHSGGCMSYLLDGATVITYLLPANAPMDALETQPKLKRQLWHIGHDKMVQSRLYPDGRDNDCEATREANKQLRKIFEDIISECCNVESSWIIGHDYKCDVMTTVRGAVNYEDYFNYDDAGVIIKYKGIKNTNEIEIGHVPICPYCGQPHSNTNTIMCSGMEDRLECTNGNGHFINLDGRCISLTDSSGESYVRCVETGKWYESAAEAEADGVFLNNDDMMWHQKVVENEEEEIEELDFSVVMEGITA